jgi:hypothetical protein
MTDRETLIEAMARAICDEWGYLWDGDPDEDSQVSPENNKGYDERPSKLLFRTAATAALAAIEAMGAVAVPVEATADMYADIWLAAQLQNANFQYRAMIAASPYAKEPT